MSDPTSPDRVPLDRPPVPRFNPLPDLPDLPEMPRGSAPMPTPSIPIPFPPPMASLPAPRVVVDLPRPSPSVTIDAPPRPAPRATLPTPPPPTPPAPTPAPKGRWVGEAITTLMRPTKAKATVVAAAGSLVAGAFALQLLVGPGDLPSPSPTRPTVAAKPAETKPPETPAAEPEKPAGITLLTTPTPTDPVKVKVAPFTMLGKLEGTSLPDPPRPEADSSPAVTIKPAAFPLPDTNFTLTGGQTPAVPAIPILPELPALPAAPLPVLPASAPAAPVALPAPPPTPTPAAPEPLKIVPATLPIEVPKAVPLPVLPLKPVEVVPKPIDLPKPPTPEPYTPTLPPKTGFVDVTPLTPTPAPAPTAPAFAPVEPTPEPRRVAPVTPAAGEARTDFDVDLHPPQAGQTYEAVSKQHYGDAKYADALRAFNKNRDPGRDELQIPPTYALRKLATAGRTPASVNPIAPAGGETWAPPATIGGSKPVAGRSYTVPDDGLTFRDLAGTLLNDRTKYRRISDLNPTLDPNARLQKGQKVVVP